MWTNTVCSHPISNIANEKDGVVGVKSAAKRKLKHELDVSPEPNENDFHFITRILYGSPSNGEWGKNSQIN